MHKFQGNYDKTLQVLKVFALKTQT